MKNLGAFIVTTIQPPTTSIQKWLAILPKGFTAYIVGDRKGPQGYDPRCKFLSIEQQRVAPFKIAKVLPENHYCRKNLGYLTAIKENQPVIFETDDDNAPLNNFSFEAPLKRALTDLVMPHPSPSPWVNVYRFFSAEKIWPRGFPLNEINSSVPDERKLTTEHQVPIQQLLADGDPDVDAIWRLVFSTPIQFRPRTGIHLAPRVYCPFNSQATWWHPQAYPLLYLPATCSFRMTDIWRSFIAQRCLHEEGMGIAFLEAQVFQDRNVHNFLNDFRQEVDGYLLNRKIIETLLDAPLRRGSILENILICYKVLVKAEVFKESELPLVDAWLEDSRP